MILSCKFECGPIQEQINNILNIDTTGGNNNISQLMEKLEIFNFFQLYF